MVGDPNCPLCGGLGYLRADLPLGHPDFGRLQICSCRRDEVAMHSRRRLYAISRLDELTFSREFMPAPSSRSRGSAA